MPEVGDRCAHIASQNGELLLEKNVFCTFATVSFHAAAAPNAGLTNDYAEICHSIVAIDGKAVSDVSTARDLCLG